jgi:hypothetical protein
MIFKTSKIFKKFSTKKNQLSCASSKHQTNFRASKYLHVLLYAITNPDVTFRRLWQGVVQLSTSVHKAIRAVLQRNYLFALFDLATTMAEVGMDRLSEICLQGIHAHEETCGNICIKYNSRTICRHRLVFRTSGKLSILVDMFRLSMVSFDDASLVPFPL